jgi:hypothetical protein
MSKRCPSTMISKMTTVRQGMQSDLGGLTQYHLEEGDREADREINIDGATSLRFHRYHLSSRRNLVQTTVDHKQCCRYTDGNADTEARSYWHELATTEGLKEQSVTNIQMSHQTGATFAMLWSQTTELMNPFKQARPAQPMNKTVPTFQARGA